MLNPIHILNQMGVITSFSVAKKVKAEDIESFFKKGKKYGKTIDEMNEILRNKVLKDIEESIFLQKIPGLVSPEEIAKNMGIQKNIIDNMPVLNKLAMVLNFKLSEKKFDKMSLCYFINSLVNMLGLTEEDFENFHKQNTSSEEAGEDED